MAYAIDFYTGNGSTTTYSLTFPYISQSDVEVKVNNVTKTLGTDYTFATSSTITFTTAPANGLIIKFTRTSNRSARLVDYQDGSTITEAILDQDSNQMFYMAQEAIDITENTIALADDDKFDANNKVIKNLANPVNSNDAVNKTYLENTWLSTADKATLTNLNANIANINTVNSNATNINAVNANSANINIVSGINSAVSQVASINADVTQVSAIYDKVTTVANNIADINQVYTDILKVVEVANDLQEATSEIDTVANAIANVDFVGNSIANVNTVATNINNVNSFFQQYKVSATQPSSPSTGDLWYDTANSRLKIYTGSSWNLASDYLENLINEYTYNITGTPTTVSGADANTNTFSYTVDSQVNVFLNGVRLIPTTYYTLSGGNTISFTSNLQNGDVVFAQVFTKLTVAQEALLDQKVIDAQDQVNLAIAQVALATTQTNLATTQASNASTSASNAATSETNAATSASNASTSETNAATSETNAASSASTATTQAGIATTQASNAATSATNAANSATTASNAQTSVENIFDNFDDRFLGTKTSDPTVDNDGNALSVGAVYYNSSANSVRFYNGSSWDAPATSAATAATNAANSASAASGSASTASTQASNASTSASNAATSETNAATSASTATTQAGIATTQATNASNSASAAATSASNAAASETNAATSEANAATSESNASTSASTATTQATNSLNSATASQVSRLASESARDLSQTYRDSSQTYATNSANSATASANSATSAQNSLDTFNDKFIASASAPSSPSDGDLWYDTVNVRLKIYIAGSGWQNAGAYLEGLISRYTYTATSGQTVFSVSDNSSVLNFTAEANVFVFLNGVRLTPISDYTLSGTNTCTLPSGVQVGDILYIEVITKISLTEEAILQGYVANALSSKNDAETAKTQAETAETNAETAETNAVAAKNASESARDLAEQYRDTASNHATTATTQAGIATTKASEAVTSASQAAASATQASQSAGGGTLKITPNDTTADNLSNKVVGGNGITVSVLNASGNEDLNFALSMTETSTTPTAGQTNFTVTYTVGYIQVFLNGIKLIKGTDFTATNGTSVVLASGATTSDVIEFVVWA